MNKKQCLTRLFLFYVFKQKFFCKEDLSEEIERITVKFNDTAEVAKENSWLDFWQTQGNEVVLNLWNFKYKDYIDNKIDDKIELENVENAKGEERSKELSTSNDQFIEEQQLTVDDKDYSNLLSWQTLWHEHTAEVYAEQYTKFVKIYENYYWVLKAALFEETPTRKSELEVYYELEDELEQLKLAGLPTAFCSKSQQKRNKRKVIKKEQVSQKIDFLFESEFAEEDSSTSESELEMPPIRYNDPDSSLTTDEQSSSEMDNDFLHNIQNNVMSKAKSKLHKNRNLRNLPEFMLQEKCLHKYWRQRFSLFSRFDEGIQLDRESWFSVTPEKVAQHMAQRLACNIIVDGFCGSGGNTIQFAKTCKKVIAIDIDPIKIEMAKNNAKIYGVSEKIEFIVGDFLELSKKGTIHADAVFLSPPWGGPEYKTVTKYNIETCLEPVGATELMRASRCISNNIGFFLPRNADIKQIIRLAGIGNTCEVEHNYLGSRIVGLTAFYGGPFTTK